MTQPLISVERFCLIGHIAAMAFGLAGLLLVMPHPEFLQHVPMGQTLFAWSMAGGGVLYIVLGAIAVALYIRRTLGNRALVTFMVPAILISLSSELMGTSTGFPFGHYSYLNGLGYKIAGLVPFTIPLSWFYLGISAFVLARASLLARRRLMAPGSNLSLPRQMVGIILAATLLMAWDFVLDPAMSQTAMPFWYWHQPGAFFGMPYQNFAGWLGTGIVFMAIAAFLWQRNPRTYELRQTDVTPALIIYLANFTFAMSMSLAFAILVPVCLGILVGAIPAVVCWYSTPIAQAPAPVDSTSVLSPEAITPTQALSE